MALAGAAGGGSVATLVGGSLDKAVAVGGGTGVSVGKGVCVAGGGLVAVKVGVGAGCIKLIRSQANRLNVTRLSAAPYTRDLTLLFTL